MVDSEKGEMLPSKNRNVGVVGRLRVATYFRGWGGDIKLSESGMLISQQTSSSIGDMNSEGGVSFSDEGMMLSICGMP